MPDSCGLVRRRRFLLWLGGSAVAVARSVAVVQLVADLCVSGLCWGGLGADGVWDGRCRRGR